jgi:anti-sigma B factor antagonist
VRKLVNLSNKHIKPGIVVMEMSGRVMMGADCKRVEQDVEAHILREEMYIIFDLTNVDHADSAFIGQIVKSFTRLSKAGGGLRLAVAPGMVEGVLKMTQVNKVIKMYPTAAEAAEDFPPVS